MKKQKCKKFEFCPWPIRGSKAEWDFGIRTSIVLFPLRARHRRPQLLSATINKWSWRRIFPLSNPIFNPHLSIIGSPNWYKGTHFFFCWKMAPRIAEEIWEQYRGEIIALYCAPKPEGTLKKTMQIMKEKYGFQATYWWLSIIYMIL